MKALTCEMCGSTNLIKKDGVFVCQSCGTQYSVEEAKKMMVEGTVDVKGTVKVDTSDELKNLYEIARRAKDSDNNENAAKYYDMILVKDPQSWEANFYVVYFKAMSCRIGEIWSAANSLYNCIPSVMELVSEHETDPNLQAIAVEEIQLRLSLAANLLANAAKNHFDELSIEIKADYIQEYVDRAAESARILYLYGDSVEIYFPEKYPNVAVAAWKDAINIGNQYLRYLDDKEGNKQFMMEYVNKIKKYESDYEPPHFIESLSFGGGGGDNSSGGCYVATAVYGSYDCPQVWTLRRYRDYTLAETWFGRAFIKTYYATSPTMVKWFGKTSWFKSIGKKLLDKKVQKLNEEGVSDLQYDDRQW